VNARQGLRRAHERFLRVAAALPTHFFIGEPPDIDGIWHSHGMIEMHVSDAAGT
jgi:hypothetical protein